MKQINLDSLNLQLFETIEMLKNNNCKEASDNEKIDVSTARTIAELGKVIVESYKVKASILKLVNKSFEPTELKQFSIESGINVKNEIKENN